MDADEETVDLGDVVVVAPGVVVGVVGVVVGVVGVVVVVVVMGPSCFAWPLGLGALSINRPATAVAAPAITTDVPTAAATALARS